MDFFLTLFLCLWEDRCQGCEWTWLKERAELCSRWTWLQMRLTELDSQIQQLGELHKHILANRVKHEHSFILPDQLFLLNKTELYSSCRVMWFWLRLSPSQTGRSSMRCGRRLWICHLLLGTCKICHLMWTWNPAAPLAF